MTQYPEPEWTDGLEAPGRPTVVTTHAGRFCRVVHMDVRADDGPSWYWTAGGDDGERAEDYRGDEGISVSLETAKACALRTAEALAVIAACKKGAPPEPHETARPMTVPDTQASEFDPQPGQPVSWRGQSGHVLEMRGCSTYLIAVDGGKTHWVDYVELSASEEATEDETPLPIPPVLLENHPSELEMEIAVQTVTRILHRVDPSHPLHDVDALAWCHMHALRYLHSVETEQDELQAALDEAGVRWADEYTSEVFSLPERVRWLVGEWVAATPEDPSPDGAER